VSDIKCPTCGQPVDAVEHNARARLSVIRETLGCVPGQTEIAATSARMAEIDRLRAELEQAKAELTALKEPPKVVVRPAFYVNPDDYPEEDMESP
jgi:DNA repair exonuclease SbcCD ATPase subunit